jgi:prepilin-type N-terminal cleavage/methylation domain-containing protein
MPVFAPAIIGWLMRRGVTLLEMVISLVLLGLLSAAAVPALSAVRDRYTVQAVAADIAGAHNRARIRAILEGQVTELEIRADSLILRVNPPAPVTVWSAPGPLAAGVNLASAPRTLSFAPSGVTMGFANATFVVTRGGARRQVVVSRLGRVRVIP